MKTTFAPTRDNLIQVKLKGRRIVHVFSQHGSY